MNKDGTENAEYVHDGLSSLDDNRSQSDISRLTPNTTNTKSGVQIQKANSRLSISKPDKARPLNKKEKVILQHELKRQ